MDITKEEQLIAEISWGYIPITVTAQNGKRISLLLHPPTSIEQGKAAIIYSTEYQKALLLGLPNENDVIKNMVAIGRWDSKTDFEIDGLRKDIHNIRRGLLDFLFNRTKLETTRSLLRRAEEALITRLNKRHILTQSSAEAHATICQQRYLISCITETENNELFWLTRNDFEQFNDVNIIIQLCELFFRQRIPIKSIRKLARSQQWRSYWEIAKETNSLFNGSVVDWSLDQRELAYWSTIYDSVYNAYERPSKDVIEDDDLLDSWFIRQGEKIEGRTQANKVSQSNKPGRNEEFIMADKEGAKRVYNMNDPGVRAQIKARQKLLNQQNTIQEQDMPDSQREMRQQLVGMQKKHVKDISHR